MPALGYLHEDATLVLVLLLLAQMLGQALAALMPTLAAAQIVGAFIIRCVTIHRLAMSAAVAVRAS